MLIGRSTEAPWSKVVFLLVFDQPHFVPLFIVLDWTL
jgi:hypothetical protein